MLIFVSGCQSSSKDIVKIVEEIKNTTKANIEPIPSFDESVQNKYNGNQFNDPFYPNNQNASNLNLDTEFNKNKAQRPDLDRSREYLENFPLDSLVMVGTLESKSGSWALIVDRSGILHKVKPGNYLGQNSGKVIQVSGEEVEIQELISDGHGGWNNRTVYLKIKNK